MHTDEYGLMQNPALGAICLWAFAHEFWLQTSREKGPEFVLLSCVLPIAYHRESVEALYARRFDGGLLNALAEDRSLMIGLQDRMEQMAEQTFEALSIAFASRLLTLEMDSFRVEPAKRTVPEFSQSEVHRQMIATAYRLGYWFATLPFEQISNYLRIRF